MGKADDSAYNKFKPGITKIGNWNEERFLAELGVDHRYKKWVDMEDNGTVYPNRSGAADYTDSLTRTLLEGKGDDVEHADFSFGGPVIRGTSGMVDSVYYCTESRVRYAPVELRVAHPFTADYNPESPGKASTIRKAQQYAMAKAFLAKKPAPEEELSTTYRNSFKKSVASSK